MSTVIQQIVTRAFGSKVVRALAKKGLTVVDSKTIPGKDGSYANGDTAYQLSDGRMLLLDVIAIAESK